MPAVHPVPRRALLIATLLTAACTTTSLVNLWHDPDYPKQPLHNVMVVTLRKDAASRRIWEDGFVAALREHGVNATPSYTLFPNAAPDTAALVGAVKDHGFDAVLVAHLASTENVTRWVPGYVTSAPGWYSGPWFGHYYTYYSRLYQPSYLETDRVVRYESEIWMTEGSGRMVWVATTASINPASSKEVNGEIADRIVPELVKQHILAAH